jgi:hypothetical protein
MAEQTAGSFETGALSKSGTAIRRIFTQPRLLFTGGKRRWWLWRLSAAEARLNTFNIKGDSHSLKFPDGISPRKGASPAELFYL